MSELYLQDANPQTVQDIIQTVSASLLNCSINEHYKEKLPYINNNTTIINDTYHTIHNDDTSCMTEHTITSKIQESMHRMVDHLKDKTTINNYNNTTTQLQMQV